MEALAIIGLVGNIVQFIDFSGKLISKSTELYRSSEGALAENIDIETITKRLLTLNKSLEDTPNASSDAALERLCASCNTVANELLMALDKVKLKSGQQKWKSLRKALQSVWSKEKIMKLDQQLAGFRDELNLHLTADLRENFSQFRLEHLNRLQDLDLITNKVLDAIIKQEDVFQHKITRDEIRQQWDTEDQQRCLDKLPIAAQAAFNSYDRQHDPLCLPNTRVDILQEIEAWTDGKDKRCIFWLRGWAGTGKSTIARTVAQTYDKQKRLGASFFFSKDDGDARQASRFFTTIATQLASNLPSLKPHICKAIADHTGVGSQSLRDQWQKIILRPLSKLDSSSFQSSFVLVIDALDECDGEKDIKLIVHLLAEIRSLRNIRLRVFMTSRPETPIQYSFCQISDAEYRDFVLHDIAQAITNDDISTFLKYRLDGIGQELALGPSWPGEHVIRRLVQDAGGLFIWAETACRFIRTGKKPFAARRLSTLLQGDRSVTAPEKYLDKLYLTVLTNKVGYFSDQREKEDLHTTLRQVLGSIAVIFSSLSLGVLAKLLDVTKCDIDQTLEDLHAILEIPKEESRPIRLHHPSFRDFLLKKGRCSDLNFLVKEEQAHDVLTNNCIRLMSTLKRDICDLRHPGALVDDVEATRVDLFLPPSIQYACLYWVQHLQKSKARLCDDGEVHVFLQEHLLHWFEALSLMGKTSESVLAIISLESMVTASDAPCLYAFIHDVKRFALYNRSIIEEAPLQLYCSALIFAPKKSMVRILFKNQIPSWITGLPNVQREWNSLLQTLEGHSDKVWAVAFSPDGKLVASASWDRTVRLWDAATGASLQTLEGHSDKVQAIAFSPDGKLVASASYDGTVRLWDAATGASLQTLEGHSDSLWAVAFSPNGKLVASASDDCTVRLWDAATGASLQTLEGHSGWVQAVAFSPDGKLVASASDDHTVRLWDAATGASLQTLEGHSDWVRAVAFSPDGKLVASASYDGTVRLWDAATGASLQTLEGHSNRVRAVAFSPDGKLVASASWDRTVRLWDAATGASLQTLEGHSDSLWAVAFSPDGKLVASASWDRTVRLWDAATGASLQTLEGHSGWVQAIAFSPDGKLVASASWDGTVRLWDTATGASLQTLEGHSDRVRALAFSPDGKLVASASWDRTVRLWDAATGASLQTLEGHSDRVQAVAFSPDGKLVASASWDGTVRLWDTATGASLQTLEGHSGWVQAVAFSPDGKLVASASGDGTVRLWDAATGASLQTLEGHSGWVQAVAFSPDGKLVASASGDGTVRLWDAATGASLQTLEGHSDSVQAVAFSPDGKLVASASDDRTVRLWDAATGASLQTLEGHSGWVQAVAFSPDGKLVASASGDGTVRLWDAATGASLQTLETANTIRQLSFSNSSQYLDTDVGQLGIDCSFSSIMSPQSMSVRERRIYVDGTWVVQEKKNVLWLSSDYRAICAVVRNNVLVIGHASGCVSILGFDVAEPSI